MKTTSYQYGGMLPGGLQNAGVPQSVNVSRKKNNRCSSYLKQNNQKKLPKKRLNYNPREIRNNLVLANKSQSAGRVVCQAKANNKYMSYIVILWQKINHGKKYISNILSHGLSKPIQIKRIHEFKLSDLPSRLHARRQMNKVLYSVTSVPAENAGKKKNTKKIDVATKVFDEIAPKYVGRNGGYTRIVKIGQRKGDGALEVLLELV